MTMTPEQVEDIIQKAIKNSVEKELGSYKIPKEQHFEDHLWITEWRKWQNTIKNSTIKTIVGIVLSAIAGLIFYGFVFFGKGIK